jgi:hypothetical protein
MINRFYLKIIQVIGLILLISANSGAAIALADAPSPEWSPPIRLSLPETTGWFPDVTADATGRVHVVWSSYVKVTDKRFYDAVFYTSSQDGRKWDKPIDVVAPDLQFGEATRPNVYADPQGTLHLTYRGTRVYYSQAPIATAAQSSSWISPRQISVSQVAYFSDLAADSQGRLHLIFTENVMTPECEICFHIFYRQSDNNGLTWSPVTEISILPLGAIKPQIITDEQDNLHVVWDAGIGGHYGQLNSPDSKMMYTASYDRGETWTYPTEFIVPGGNGKNITIGVDGQGRVLVVWLALSQKLVYYQFSEDKGRSWSRPFSIPNVIGGGVGPELDNYIMASDSAGQLHLLMVGRTKAEEQGISVLHLVWDGTTWSSPKTITTLFGDVPEWPRIAIGNGNQLHAVWFVRDEEHIWDSDKQEYEIWYAQAQADAPAKTAVAQLPTPIPLPTPTSLPLSVPSPTPTVDPGINRVPASPEAAGTIYTEVDDVLLLIQSLLPALLIVIVVVVIIRLWRR